FKNIVAWIFGISFIATGILKLIDLDTMSGSLFKRANYPQWLWLFTGVLELTGGVLAVVKPTRQFGFLLIVVVMCGAIGTH
ncbi:UNVERIFIED_CONTAM: DoxX family protein, partial [Salmonella enterica subsp. enterica serovar Weltevreden]